jgi:hypothetical protein
MFFGRISFAFIIDYYNLKPRFIDFDSKLDIYIILLFKLFLVKIRFTKLIYGKSIIYYWRTKHTKKHPKRKMVLIIKDDCYLHNNS